MNGFDFLISRESSCIQTQAIEKERIFLSDSERRNSEDLKRCLTVSIVRYVFRRLASSCSNQLFARMMKLQMCLKRKEVRIVRFSFNNFLRNAHSKQQNNKDIRKAERFHKQRIKHTVILAFKAALLWKSFAISVMRRKDFSLYRTAWQCFKENVWENIEMSGVSKRRNERAQDVYAVAAIQKQLQTRDRSVERTLLQCWRRWREKSSNHTRFLLDSACFHLEESKQKWIATGNELIKALTMLRQTEEYCRTLSAQLEQKEKIISCLRVLFSELFSVSSIRTERSMVLENEQIGSAVDAYQLSSPKINGKSVRPQQNVDLEAHFISLLCPVTQETTVDAKPLFHVLEIEDKRSERSAYNRGFLNFRNKPDSLSQDHRCEIYLFSTATVFNILKHYSTRRAYARHRVSRAAAYNARRMVRTALRSLSLSVQMDRTLQGPAKSRHSATRAACYCKNLAHRAECLLSRGLGALMMCTNGTRQSELAAYKFAVIRGYSTAVRAWLEAVQTSRCGALAQTDRLPNLFLLLAQSAARSERFCLWSMSCSHGIALSNAGTELCKFAQPALNPCASLAARVLNAWGDSAGRTLLKVRGASCIAEYGPTTRTVDNGRCGTRLLNRISSFMADGLADGIRRRLADLFCRWTVYRVRQRLAAKAKQRGERKAHRIFFGRWDETRQSVLSLRIDARLRHAACAGDMLGPACDSLRHAAYNSCRSSPVKSVANLSNRHPETLAPWALLQLLQSSRETCARQTLSVLWAGFGAARLAAEVAERMRQAAARRGWARAFDGWACAARCAAAGVRRMGERRRVRWLIRCFGWVAGLGRRRSDKAAGTGEAERACRRRCQARRAVVGWRRAVDAARDCGLERARWQWRGPSRVAADRARGLLGVCVDGLRDHCRRMRWGRLRGARGRGRADAERGRRAVEGWRRRVVRGRVARRGAARWWGGVVRRCWALWDEARETAGMAVGVAVGLGLEEGAGGGAGRAGTVAGRLKEDVCWAVGAESGLVHVAARGRDGEGMLAEVWIRGCGAQGAAAELVRQAGDSESRLRSRPVGRLARWAKVCGLLPDDEAAAAALAEKTRAEAERELAEEKGRVAAAEGRLRRLVARRVRGMEAGRERALLRDAFEATAWYTGACRARSAECRRRGAVRVSEGLTVALGGWGRVCREETAGRERLAWGWGGRLTAGVQARRDAGAREAVGRLRAGAHAARLAAEVAERMRQAAARRGWARAFDGWACAARCAAAGVRRMGERRRVRWLIRCFGWVAGLGRRRSDKAAGTGEAERACRRRCQARRAVVGWRRAVDAARDCGLERARWQWRGPSRVAADRARGLLGVCVDGLRDHCRRMRWGRLRGARGRGRADAERGRRAVEGWRRRVVRGRVARRGAARWWGGVVRRCWALWDEARETAGMAVGVAVGLGLEEGAGGGAGRAGTVAGRLKEDVCWAVGAESGLVHVAARGRDGEGMLAEVWIRGCGAQGAAAELVRQAGDSESRLRSRPVGRLARWAKVCGLLPDDEAAAAALAEKTRAEAERELAEEKGRVAAAEGRLRRLVARRVRGMEAGRERALLRDAFEATAWYTGACRARSAECRRRGAVRVSEGLTVALGGWGRVCREETAGRERLAWGWGGRLTAGVQARRDAGAREAVGRLRVEVNARQKVAGTAHQIQRMVGPRWLKVLLGHWSNLAKYVTIGLEDLRQKRYISSKFNAFRQWDRFLYVSRSLPVYSQISSFISFVRDAKQDITHLLADFTNAKEEIEMLHKNCFSLHTRCLQKHLKLSRLRFIVKILNLFVQYQRKQHRRRHIFGVLSSRHHYILQSSYFDRFAKQYTIHTKRVVFQKEIQIYSVIRQEPKLAALKKFIALKQVMGARNLRQIQWALLLWTDHVLKLLEFKAAVHSSNHLRISHILGFLSLIIERWQLFCFKSHVLVRRDRQRKTKTLCNIFCAFRLYLELADMSYCWRKLTNQMTVKFKESRLRKAAAVSMYQFDLIYSMRSRLQRKFTCLSALKVWQRKVRE